MPLYEYQCQDCGKISEVRQKFSDAPLTVCEACGGTVKKLISQTGFALKGGGWYDQGYCGSSSASPGSDCCSTCPKAS
jgi:putative FmdB family regulatory protein